MVSFLCLLEFLESSWILPGYHHSHALEILKEHDLSLDMSLHPHKLKMHEPPIFYAKECFLPAHFWVLF